MYFSERLGQAKVEYDKEWTDPSKAYIAEIPAKGVYEIYAVSGGAGGLYCDGGTDAFSDTAWAYHYYFSGATGGFYHGYITLQKGSHEIRVGGAGSGNVNWPTGGGGDTYIKESSTTIFNITGGQSQGTSYGSVSAGGAGGSVSVNTKQVSTYTNTAINGLSKNLATYGHDYYYGSAPRRSGPWASQGYSAYSAYGMGGGCGFTTSSAGSAGYLRIIYYGRR